MVIWEKLESKFPHGFFFFFNRLLSSFGEWRQFHNYLFFLCVCSKKMPFRRWSCGTTSPCSASIRRHSWSSSTFQSHLTFWGLLLTPRSKDTKRWGRLSGNHFFTAPPSPRRHSAAPGGVKSVLNWLAMKELIMMDGITGGIISSTRIWAGLHITRTNETPICLSDTFIFKYLSQKQDKAPLFFLLLDISFSTFLFSCQCDNILRGFLSSDLKDSLRRFFLKLFPPNRQTIFCHTPLVTWAPWKKKRKDESEDKRR